MPAEQLEAQRREAVNKLIAKCANLSCGVCEKAEWQGGGVFGLVEMTFMPGLVGDEVERLPASAAEAQDVVVALRCKVCGRVVLFSAQAAGINVGR
jgi:hypothetical protein